MSLTADLVIGTDETPLSQDLDHSHAVVIAMGPWSAPARHWLPVPDVYGLKGHSIVLRPANPVPAEALFADVETEDGMSDTPELFPRPDDTVHLCGLSSQVPTTRFRTRACVPWNGRINFAVRTSQPMS